MVRAILEEQADSPDFLETAVMEENAEERHEHGVREWQTAGAMAEEAEWSDEADADPIDTVRG